MSEDWETPQDFFDTLDREFNFTLDPCAADDTAKCASYFTKEDNSLDLSWGDHTVFMNPPYNKKIGLWMEKAYNESRNGSVVVCLISGRSTDTIWWHKYVMKADEIRFVADRIHFGLNKKFTRANISSIVVIFRSESEGYPKVSTIDNKGYPTLERKSSRTSE